MRKHRTKSEARGLTAATKRSPKTRVSAAERKQDAAERAERKLEREVYESTLMMLPFITEKKGKRGKPNGRDFWNVKETGNFMLDAALGEKLGAEFLRYGKKRGDDATSMFCSVIEDMIEKGPEYCKFVRMGFLSVLRDVMPDGYDFDAEQKRLVLLR